MHDSLQNHVRIKLGLSVQNGVGFFYKNTVEQNKCFEIPLPLSVEIAAKLNMDDFIQILQQ